MATRSGVTNRRIGSLYLACALWLCSAGTVIAQAVPLVFLPPPPVPFGPTGLALAGAYDSINRAVPVDPSAALRAAFAYEAALARLRMGDTFGARAEAVRAQAIAGWAGAGTSISPPVQVAGSPLPGYILDARDRIWQAQDRGIDTRDATRYLRVAVDAYLDGNAPRAQSEAHAAIASLPAK
jgi:hypothetical protein